MLYLMNTTIMPNEGVFSCKKVSYVDALQITEKYRSAGGDQVTSAIGHQGTADALNVLGFCDGKVQVNRIAATFQKGDHAICMKTKGGVEEGKVLSLDDLNEVGFEFYHVWMVSESMENMETEALYCGASPITGSIWNNPLY